MFSIVSYYVTYAKGEFFTPVGREIEPTQEESIAKTELSSVIRRKYDCLEQKPLRRSARNQSTLGIALPCCSGRCKQAPRSIENCLDRVTQNSNLWNRIQQHRPLSSDSAWKNRKPNERVVAATPKGLKSCPMQRFESSFFTRKSEKGFVMLLSWKQQVNSSGHHRPTVVSLWFRAIS